MIQGAPVNDPWPVILLKTKPATFVEMILGSATVVDCLQCKTVLKTDKATNFHRAVQTKRYLTLESVVATDSHFWRHF
jgi:ATP phosphoribosyltransferase regulatory subunit HisZ